MGRTNHAQNYLIVHLSWCHRGGAGEDHPGDNTAVNQDPMVPHSGVFAQHKMMRGCSQHGLEHPAQRVTKKGWRERFVKVLIHDDLAFWLGEGEGMRDILTYILPGGYMIPSHQTV
jgi:hypothetical protein